LDITIRVGFAWDTGSHDIDPVLLSVNQSIYFISTLMAHDKKTIYDNKKLMIKKNCMPSLNSLRAVKHITTHKSEQ